MYSLNVPVPSSVARLASELAREVPRAQERTRGEHTLVLKRLGQDRSVPRLQAQIREYLAGQPPFEAQVTGIDYFANATNGPSPVVYLTVESPELRRVHAKLVAKFSPVEGMEGDDYSPHVTIARGGDRATTTGLAERSIEPITWTVSRLTVRDARRGEPASSVSLPI
ncbi:2'-5' RNA ligase family protein [Halorhabdus sp. CBA1104]|uniref:2'-5' RNA ligase family protein n=1 Tax=Halorhabdus sp. CBA1104 TaxID=1380432 RepID=UPI0012B3109B|nr:2'-5' RNA ligase family protein [Halorhabdus sp. CBA1104]QGN08001.1 2'-5' RNA ligase family protein [Halorhabdus sp. CBA1104]